MKKPTHQASYVPGAGATLRMGHWQELFSKDENAAWAAIFEHLCRALKRRRSFRGTTADAHDVAQTIILRWLSKGHNCILHWDPEAPLQAFVSRVVTNHLRDAYKTKRGRDESICSLTKAWPEIEYQGQEASLLDMKRDFQDLFAQIPAPHGTILLWRLQGCTQEEIALKMRVWGRVGPDRSKQIVREAVSLAHNSYFGDGELLRHFLLRNKNARKSRWEVTPPPP